MMPDQAQDPLAAFKHIQMPEVSTWWPLAWGWWLVILIALVALFFSCQLLIKQYKLRIAKQQALAQIKQLEQASSLISLNSLLKRALMSYLPRHSVASLHGAKWQALLISLLPENKQAEYQTQFNALLSGLYQADKKITDADKTLVTNYLKQVLPISSSKKNKVMQQLATHTSSNKMMDQQEVGHV